MHVRIVRKVQPRSIVAGVDLSLRGTGLAFLADGKLVRAAAWTDLKGLQQKFPHRLCWFKMGANTDSARQHRIDLLASWVLQAILEMRATHVAIEGYAFSKRSTGLSDIHELSGAVKGGLWRAGIPFRIYDPMSIKLYWTGSGSAEKTDMVQAAGRRFAALSQELPELLTANEDAAGNIADSTLIAALLHEELKVKAGLVPLDRMPERERRVMLRVTKAEPEALTTRAFVRTKEADGQPEPILATGAVSM